MTTGLGIAIAGLWLYAASPFIGKNTGSTDVLFALFVAFAGTCALIAAA